MRVRVCSCFFVWYASRCEFVFCECAFAYQLMSFEAQHLVCKYLGLVCQCLVCWYNDGFVKEKDFLRK